MSEMRPCIELLASIAISKATVFTVLESRRWRNRAMVLLTMFCCFSPPSFAAVPSLEMWMLTDQCIRSDPEAACLGFQTTPTTLCSNFGGGRPFVGADVVPQPNCLFNPPPGFQLTGIAGICAWLEQDGKITTNGAACGVTTCPPNSTLSGGQCVCNSGFGEEGSPPQCIDPAAEIQLKNLGDCDASKGAPCAQGNPVHPATGNKIERQLIYGGVDGFELSLFFNSFDSFAVRFGANWRDSFNRVLRFVGLHVVAHRADGKAIRFVPSGGSWVGAQPDIIERLLEIKNGSGSTTGWQLTSSQNDEVEDYDVHGRLIAIRQRGGRTQTLVYSDGTTGPNGGFVLDANGNPTTTPLPINLLIRASDNVGRVITFGYNASSRIIKVTDPAAGIYRFSYAGSMLSGIVWPDTQSRSYLYNESAHTGGANLPTALTGILDEKGNRFATFDYDSQQRVVSTEHAGTTNKYTFSYGSSTTAVTSPLGAVRAFDFSTVQRVIKNPSITSSGGTAPCPECGPASQTLDANGNVTTRIDWNGNRTNYGYDMARNLETSRTEALTSGGSTTAQTRTITAQWDANYRLSTGIAEPLRITTMTYGAPSDSNPGNRGSLLTRTIQATTDTNGSQGFSATTTGTPRTWTYTYNANGSVLTVNGPRTDVSDVTTYAYYSNTANNCAVTVAGASAVGCRGQVNTATNALGHVTTVNEYNAHGQPVKITDPNGLVTTLAYDARQRVTSINPNGEPTTYAYDDVGQLTRMTVSNGSYHLDYAYDNAHRLVQVEDNQGNKIEYTLDSAGNRTLEQVKDPANVLVQTQSRVYSNLSRLSQDIGAAGQTTAYGYDNQGNVTSIDGPLSGAGDTTTNTYDALNRLATKVDPAGGGTTAFGYSGRDRLTSVTDPRSLVTTYGYDGLDNLTQLASPDTGAVANTYDAAGNLLTQADAKGQVTTYTYDALNRVATITYQGGVVHTYTYDQGINQKGRLTQLVEPNSTTTYTYDQWGRLTSETRLINGVSYATGYVYDASGRLERLTYPSGRQVVYNFDVISRVFSIAATKDGVTQTLVGSVMYQPYGGVKTFSFGNGQTYTRVYDQDGRVSSYNLGGLTQALTYDPAGRITQIQDQGGGTTRGFGYDLMDRVLSATIPGNNQTYTYDANGNRASHNGVNYSYFSNTNRLQSTGAVSYAYDNNGSATTAGTNTFTYDTRGRLAQAATAGGNAVYKVNALGQRIVKQFGGVTTVYHYDKDGRLIAESNSAGVVQREYVYLYDQPVSLFVENP